MCSSLSPSPLAVHGPTYPLLQECPWSQHFTAVSSNNSKCWHYIIHACDLIVHGHVISCDLLYVITWYHVTYCTWPAYILTLLCMVIMWLNVPDIILLPNIMWLIAWSPDIIMWLVLVSGRTSLLFMGGEIYPSLTTWHQEWLPGIEWVRGRYFNIISPPSCLQHYVWYLYRAVCYCISGGA